MEATITQAWPWLPGGPGKPLLEEVAAILDDAPFDEFRVLLESKGRRVKSFGLAEHLAREFCERRKNEAAARKEADAARERAEAANRKREILEWEELLADPYTPQEEREKIPGYIAELERPSKPAKSEPARAKRGAA